MLTPEVCGWSLYVHLVDHIYIIVVKLGATEDNRKLCIVRRLAISKHKLRGLRPVGVLLLFL